ncbi:YvrJ family protein [Caldibacillus lycopersici]|uniref:YvrJ family protein n=1 Tax=Perspicuibacillus lycopersici TaxID=1325689 RepID=A0AAE3LLP2_9BACI|nr:YvrJ family protein [Perspicuibacillus lycopersici]MCU9611952.1 YvrJ family protein [Perspicuibacillus lycopersici]
MNEILPFVSEVGFPIVVTLILLYRIEVKLDQVVHSIEQLAEHIAKV